MSVPAVVVTGQLAQDSQLQLLLQQARRPPPPPPEFTRLLDQPRASSDFQRLLQQDYAPRDLEVRVTAKRTAKKFVRKAARALTRVAAPVGAFVTLYDTLDFLYERFAKQSARKSPPNSGTPNDVLDSDSGANRRRVRPAVADPRFPAALDPVNVIGSVGDPFGIAGLQALGFYNPPAKNPFPRRPAGERYDYPAEADPLTRPRSSKRESSKPKTQTQRQRYDFVTRGDCVTFRRKRPSCPARGYKLRAVKWEKVPCQ